MADFSHPLMGADPATLCGALVRNRGVSWKCALHALAFLGASLARSPITLLELAMMSGKAAEMKTPLFIVGHWRSGTTHLHNLVGRSQEFGIISPLAAGLPWETLTLATWLRPLLELALPKDRGVDRVAVTGGSPQEDEIPVASMQPYSVFHAIYFPRQFEKNFAEGVFFEGLSEEEIKRWGDKMRYFLRKVSRHQGGKRLLIKNPVYTARVRRIREIWPDAKFIHIYRNPYTVYASTVRYFKKLLPSLALQSYESLDVERLVLKTYPRMLDELYESTTGMGASQFAEVRFEELEQEPLKVLERLYKDLELEDWETSREATEAYLKSIDDYRKNQFTIAKEDQAAVDEHWGKYVKKWGYSAPEN